MEQYRSRRALLATLSLGVIAGCLSSLDDTDEDEDTDEECDLASGQWQGEGEPIITRAGLNQEETEEFDRDGREIELECARVAAEAAFDELNRCLDIDIDGQDWSGYGSGIGRDGVFAFIVFESLRGRDGSLYHCPDPEFEIATAQGYLPAEVTVTLDVTEWDEQYECTHEIQLLARHVQED